MWDAPVSNQNVLVMQKLKRNGGGQVRIAERRAGCHGRVLLGRIKQENERREWRKSAKLGPVE